MEWRDAINSLLTEFKKIDFKSGCIHEAIDLKLIESKLRILTIEIDKSSVTKEELISIVPAIFLCLCSNDRTCRQTIARFLPGLKGLIEAVSCTYNDWKHSINSEFAKLCADQLILIVEEFSDDWIEPWLLLIKILFSDVEGGSFTDVTLFNYLLSVVEKAFKIAKVKTEKFQTAFQTWERFCTILSESLSCNKFLSLSKRLQLIVLPFISIKHLSADPYKHRAWFHVIQKIGLHSAITVESVVSHFLHFLIETRRLFDSYKDDVGSYLKKLSQCSLIISGYSSELLKCLELAIAHGAKREDVVATWTSLCDHLVSSDVDHEYFKKLLNFLKSTADNEEEKELIIDLCIIAYQFKLFDFKSVYFNDIRVTCEELFPVTITSPVFRKNVFHIILAEMLEMTESVSEEFGVDKVVFMTPILSMWELMVKVYSGYVDASLDSRFVPTSVDIPIIRDLIILPLTQPLNKTPQEENVTGKALGLFLRCLVIKTKTDLLSSDFLQKLNNGIQSSQISLGNSLWLASFISKLEYEVNLIPLLGIISRSIASCGQPKAVMEFLGILDQVTEKTGLKINFKATLNYLRKFSSVFEPPYDQQIRQLSFSLLKRIPESVEDKPSSISSSESDEKRAIRTPTFQSNFLSRLSKAEEKKNNKNILSASLFPRSTTEEAETNKENKQNMVSKDMRINEMNVSPINRFAKSSAFVFDNTESSESLQDDNFEPKVANFKVSTDFHKSPGKINEPNQTETGLSSNFRNESKIKDGIVKIPTPKSPLNDKAPNSDEKPSRTPNKKTKYSYLDDSLDTQDFVFIPPKGKTSPLTKHQKEKMNKRREEIPALYQDLSQDTQNTSELSSSEQSSQENVAFGLNKRTDDTPIQESLEHQKKEEDNTCIIEENAVFKNFVVKDPISNGPSSIIISAENQNDDLKEEGSITPKRLNFEGICGKSETTPNNVNTVNKEIISPGNMTPSPRTFFRKSTSKYRKVNAHERKIDNQLDSNESEGHPYEKLTVDTAQAKSALAHIKPTSHEIESNSSEPKRRGRKKKKMNGTVSVDSPSTDNYNSMITSPLLTRRKLKSVLQLEESKTLQPNVENENNTRHYISKTNNGDREQTSNLQLEKSSDIHVLTSDSQVHVQSSDNVVESLGIHSKISESTDTDSKETSGVINQIIVVENMEVIEHGKNLNDVSCTPSKMTDLANSSNSSTVDTSIEIGVKFLEEPPTTKPEITTPPSIETPNRRKRNKRTIQFNEFSPKMLRKGKIIKNNQANDKIKRKSLDLEKTEANVIVNKKPDSESISQIESSESNNLLDTKFVVTCNESLSLGSKGYETDSEKILEHQLNNAESNTDFSKPEDTSFKLSSKQNSHLMNCKQRGKDVNSTSNSKTSPTRAMKIMLLVNNSCLSTPPDALCSNVVELEDSNLSQNPLNQKNNIKFNSSRASLIMKNLKDKSKPADAASNTPEPKIVESDSINETDLNSGNLSKNISDNSPHQSLLKGKRKYLMRSPVDKRMKKSGLDNWLIKKEKSISPDRITQAIASADSQKVDSTESVANCAEVSINVHSSESPNQIQNSNNLESILQQTEIRTNEDTPSRWPRRLRGGKKSMDFTSSPLKRCHTPDNKTVTKKAKPQKVLELSPSKPYSFVNWPKGDCETWIACEPTPPEASPASAILKRRSAYLSPSNSQTSPSLSQKKRVSFLDPPVSKGLLYSKEDGVGEVQHSLHDTGYTNFVRKKIIFMGIPNCDMDERDRAVGNNLKILGVTEVSSVNESENILNIPKVVDKVENDKPMAVDESANSVLPEVNGKTESTTETEPDPLVVVEDDDYNNDDDGFTAIDDDNSETSVKETRTQNLEQEYCYPLESNSISEPLSVDESHSLEEQEIVDIVEKVVGKANEAACIVEPIEICDIPEVLSDDSTVNVEQDYMNITEDIVFMTEKEQEEIVCKNNRSPKTEEFFVNPVPELKTDKAQESSKMFCENQPNLDEQSEVSEDFDMNELDNHCESAGETVISENSGYSADLYEKRELEMVTDDRHERESVSSVLNDEKQSTSSCSDKTEVQTESMDEAKHLNIVIRENENTPGMSSAPPQDIAEPTPSPSVHNLTKDKLLEVSRILNTIDPEQIPSSSLQDIVSIIFTMTTFAQKLVGQS